MLRDKIRGVLRPYTVTICAVCLVATLLLSSWILWHGIINEKLNEKFLEFHRAIDYPAEQIEDWLFQGHSWEEWQPFYEDYLINNIQKMDDEYMIFASIYNSSLEHIHSRHPSYEDSPVKPFDFPGFKETIQRNNKGDKVYWFETKTVEGRDLYVYFRWTPINADIPDPYLLVVGISKFSVATSMGDTIIWTLVTLITLCIIIFYWLVQYLGDIINDKIKTMGIVRKRSD